MLRKSYHRNLFLLFAFVFMVLCWSSSASFAVAKFYTLDEIQISAQINEDGSLNITENRTFNFHGPYRWADYSLPLRKLGKVTDFSLSEGEKDYQQSDSKEPGTYFITQSKNKFYVKWFYRASSEKRTFTLSYRVTDAVKVYRDIAEFYYQFVSAKKPKKIGHVGVSLSLPQFADTSEVRAWLHTSLNGYYHFADGKIRFEVAPLPQRKFFEVRVIFPTTWVPAATVRIDKDYRQFIVAEERGFAEKANKIRRKQLERQQFREKYTQPAKSGLLYLFGFGLLALLYLYNRFGKPYAIPGLSRLSSEIPEDVTPATASLILTNGQLNSGAITGTLIDLAARGYIKMDEKEEQHKVLFLNYKTKNQTLMLDREKFQAEEASLKEHERDFIHFFFDELAEGNSTIRTDEIRKHRMQVMKWFKHWRKKVKNEWGDRPIYDKASVKATTYFAIFSAIIIVIGIFVTIKVGLIGLVGILGGNFLLMGSFLILRYTKETKALRMKLLAVKNYLKKYEYRRDPATLQSNFSRYFAMAIAMGIGAKAMKKLILFAAQNPAQNYFPYYYTSIAHATPHEFADSVSSFVFSINTSMASAAGTGGGASSGGGGGAGGAAGGAG